MKTAIVLFFSLGLNACGARFDTQCAGSYGIPCDWIGLPICTSQFGDEDTHAFCTKKCDTDADCEPDGVCVDRKFPLGHHSVCLAPRDIVVK
jgi:hypothetical protein